MLKKPVEKALNQQLNDELRSAYLYYAMAAHFEGKNLGGFAHWMHEQTKEEMLHAQKFFAYILERGGNVKLETLEAPIQTWKTPVALFEAVLKHEQKVTASIHKLVDLARKHSDHPSEAFLQWFVTEQVEEESSVDDIIQKLKLVGSAGHGVFMIDRELASRPAASMPAGE